MKIIIRSFTILILSMLSVIISSCSISAEKEYINNIQGIYKSYRVPGDMATVDHYGNISQEGNLIYQLHHVFSPNKATYYIIDSNYGVGYVPVFYQTDMLYMGNSSTNYQEVDFTTITLFGMKTT